MRDCHGVVGAPNFRPELDDRVRKLVARHAVRRGVPPLRVIEAIEKFLEEPPQDQDIPLAEMQHRVKNEMQLLSAAMRRRRDMLEDSDRSRCDACIGQVAALAQLNAAIEDGSESSDVDLGQQVLRFASALRSAFGLDTETRQLAVRTDQYFVPWKVARNLLLIMNEAVTNAVKHGMKADGVAIRVALTSISCDAAELRVENRSISEPGRRDGGRGRSLIDALADGIGGHVVRSADSERFSLVCRFPLPRSRSGEIAH